MARDKKKNDPEKVTWNSNSIMVSGGKQTFMVPQSVFQAAKDRPSLRYQFEITRFDGSTAAHDWQCWYLKDGAPPESKWSSLAGSGRVKPCQEGVVAASDL